MSARKWIAGGERAQREAMPQQALLHKVDSSFSRRMRYNTATAEYVMVGQLEGKHQS